MSSYFPLAGSNAVIPQLAGKDLYIGDNTRYASYASYGSNVAAPSADGRVNGVNITALNKRTRTSYASAADCVKTWTTRTSAADNAWISVCWSSELSIFVAVAETGTGDRVMTSPDGITWTARTSAADNFWRSVCWASELSLFVAVAASGTGDRVMTSPDGITWTARTPAADNNWRSVCWSSELSLFVAVANTGADNRVMTSPDGITWTLRTSAADNQWRSVCWSSELSLFVAVANTGTGNRVMTSPNGVTWTARTSAADNSWWSVCWSSEFGLFVAVAASGTGNRVMTSPDGITWTARTSAADNSWLSVCWASELSLFVAVAQTGTGNRVMTSPDGITWTLRTSAADNSWLSVCWAPELSSFVAVASTGAGNRVMTSAIGMPNSKSVVKALPSQMTVLPNGNVGIGTTNPLAKLQINGYLKGQTIGFHVAATGGAGGTHNTTDNILGGGFYPEIITNVGNCWNATTGRFTPTISGYYTFNFSVYANGNTSVQLRKNATNNATGDLISGFQMEGFSFNGNYIVLHGSAFIYLNGTTDYVVVTRAFGNPQVPTGNKVTFSGYLIMAT
jgi:hypothetical protein